MTREPLNSGGFQKPSRHSYPPERPTNDAARDGNFQGNDLRNPNADIDENGVANLSFYENSPSISPRAAV